MEITKDEKGNITSVTFKKKDHFDPITIELGDLVQGRDRTHYDSYSVKSNSLNIFTVKEIYTTINGNICFNGYEGLDREFFHESLGNINLLKSNSDKQLNLL